MIWSAFVAFLYLLLLIIIVFSYENNFIPENSEKSTLSFRFIYVDIIYFFN